MSHSASQICAGKGVEVVLARTLRFRVALLFTTLLLVVLAVFFFMVRAANLGIFDEQAEQELKTGQLVFHRLLEQNNKLLIQATQVLVGDFAFREALATADGPTMLSALKNHANRLGAQLVLLSDLQGSVPADNMGVARDGLYPFPDLLKEVRQNGVASGIKVVKGEAYELVVVPVKAPVVIGWITLGVKLTEKVALDLKAMSGLEVSFLTRGADGHWHSFASTLKPAELQDLLKQPESLAEKRLELAGAPFQTRIMPLASGSGGKVFAVLQRPLKEILAPFYALQKAMLGLAMASLVLCILASFKVAGVVTRPLHRLVTVAKKIRDGSYTEHVERPETSELAALADSLDHMQVAIAEREQEILALAYRDTLTGLLNRAGFLGELGRRLESPQQSHTVLLLDLDRFQQLNDTLGHAAGDRVIMRIGFWLHAEVARFGGVLARLGGDEFAFVVAGTGYQEVLQAVLHGFERQLAVDEKKLDVRASIGIASYPEHASTPQDLLRCADEAMYVSKRKKCTVSVYDAAKRQFREEHLSLLGDLKEALNQEQLTLHYQPKVALDGSLRCEAEALVRWEHPVRGFVPPFEFIPFAEQTGYIREITHWVIARGCIDAADLLAQGMPVRVSVNLSTRDLLDPALPAFVDSCLRMAGLPKQYLCLEITESGVMEDPDKALETLHALRNMGMALAIDDYGTGYSSLACVKQLPVSELKIDRAFVKGVVESEADAMIVRSTTELAHSLGFKVVAEGVETLEISDKLRELGCDYGQGYYYSRPVPLAAFASWLKRYQLAGQV
jgi:diguanylate cyclase (GGDEF)-like protein